MPFLKVLEKKRSLMDGESPISFLDRLDGPNAFVLDKFSSGDFAFIGFDPFMTVFSRNGVAEAQILKDEFGQKKVRGNRILDGDPLKVLSEFVRSFQLKGAGALPFGGGLVGYIGYDFGCSLLGIKQQVNADMILPDFYFGFYDKTLTIDLRKNTVSVTVVAETEISLQRKIGEIETALSKPAPLRRWGEINEWKPIFNDDQLKEKFELLSGAIKAGQLETVNFSQRFSGDFAFNPFSVYRRFNNGFAGPNCFFHWSDLAVGGVGCEILSKKGYSLVLDGRPTDVKNENRDFFDYLMAVHPARCVSGSPRREAVSLIDRLEAYKRGVFGATAGFLGFNGNAEFIGLNKTLLMDGEKGYFQTGKLFDANTKLSEMNVFSEEAHQIVEVLKS
jgi:anthranilate/para-aminobenzoate synthase component I